MKLLLLLLTLFPLMAFANSVANGGDAVICYTDISRTQITSMELFDYWELRQNSAFPIKLGSPQLPVHKKIEIAVSRLEKFDPFLAKRIADSALSMEEKIGQYLVDGTELPEIDDTNPRLIPSTPCYIEQFAVQFQNVATGKRKFAISKSFYTSPLMSNDSRAGIILHEAIYREAIKLKHTDSRGTRLLNYIMATEQFNESTIQDFRDIFVEAGFLNKDCKPVYNDFFKQVILTNNRNLCSPVNYKFFNFEFNFSQGVIEQDGKNKIYFRAQLGDSWMTYKKDGKKYNLDYSGITISLDLKQMLSFSIYLPGNHNIPFTIDHPTLGQMPCAEKSAYSYIVGAKGQILGCDLEEATQINIHGQMVNLEPRRRVVFHENYKVSSLYTDDEIELPIAGTSRLAKFKYSIQLDQNEKVINASAMTRPITIDTPQGRVVVEKIEGISPQGVATGSLIKSFPPTHLGKRIVNFNADWMCRRLGFETYDTWTNPNIRRVFVKNSELMYDTILNALVSVEDEYVNVLESDFSCKRAVKVQL